MYNEKLCNRWINKALELAGHGVTIEEILKKEGEELKGKGKKKGIDPYYITYPFHNDEEYNKWMDYLGKEIKKLNPNLSEDRLEIEIRMMDALLSLSQPYLFIKQIENIQELI